MVQIREVLQHEVDKFLPFILPYLEKAAGRSRETCDAIDFAEDILNGIQAPFLVYSEGEVLGAFTMALQVFEVKKVAELVAIAIDPSDEDRIFPEVFKAAEAWGRRYGAAEIEGTGRPGWARRMKTYGCKTHFVTVGKEIKYA